MISNASNFIRNRGKNATRLTSNRIDAIIWYVAECYELIKEKKPKYSLSWVKSNTTFNFEDYLKMELVDNYLQKNKQLIFSKTNDLVEFTFNYETEKRFVDNVDGKHKRDKIDIYVSNLGLQEQWNDTNENIYFAIECKRIKILSDCEDYTLDTEKFANRDYTSTRLSFEGQLAFIERNTLNHSSVSNEINRRLPSRKKLTTKQPLKSVTKHTVFDGCYHSIHNRNTKPKQKFEVYHLLFDYSLFVIA